MVRVVTTGNGQEEKAKRPKHAEYPWAKWFGMKTFVLRKGKDYCCRTSVMASQIRNKCLNPKYPYYVSLRISDDERTITVEVTGRKPTPAQSSKRF